MSTTASIAIQDITGMVLAGGRGNRMGGVDKGLQPFHGVPLALHALQRLQRQVGHCMLNANRSLEHYAQFGVPVHTDVLPDYAGPLAGFLTGLTHCSTDWLLTVPCASPCFPQDLAARMTAVAAQQGAQIVLAAGPEVGRDGTLQVRPQPVFALLHTACCPACRPLCTKAAARLTPGPASTARPCAALICRAMIHRPLPTPIRWTSCRRYKINNTAD